MSKVERGHLPSPWAWEDWAEAYDLSVKRFRELCENGRRDGWGLPLWEMVEKTDGQILQTSAPGIKGAIA